MWSQVLMILLTDVVVPRLKKFVEEKGRWPTEEETRQDIIKDATDGINNADEFLNRK